MQNVRVYFYRNGREITNVTGGASQLLHFGVPTGQISRWSCFESVTIAGTIPRTLTQDDFAGPVSVKVWRPGSKPQWFALADRDTVLARTEPRVAVPANQAMAA